MSEQQIPQVRDEEPELSDEALEQVAGGCQVGQTIDMFTKVPPSPIEY
ncbi:MAG TPA: hypothetical protein VEX86_16350 [Longimicrobium sp.]|nr:hypothetical protein [Longimicrobium sp.]